MTDTAAEVRVALEQVMAASESGDLPLYTLRVQVAKRLAPDRPHWDRESKRLDAQVYRAAEQLVAAGELFKLNERRARWIRYLTPAAYARQAEADAEARRQAESVFASWQRIREDLAEFGFVPGGKAGEKPKLYMGQWRDLADRLSFTMLTSPVYSMLCDVIERARHEARGEPLPEDGMLHTSSEARKAANRLVEILNLQRP